MMDYDTKHLFLTDKTTGRIRFTKLGLEKLGTRFAKAGINPKSIRTREDYLEAVDAMFQSEMEESASKLKGKSKELDEALKGLPGWEE